MQHRLRKPEHPRIIDRGHISDLSVSSKVYLAAPRQDDGVGAVFVGGDAVSALINYAIAVCSGRLEPPAGQTSGKGIRGMIMRERTYSPISKSR